jgi:hypothetical protein
MSAEPNASLDIADRRGEPACAASTFHTAKVFWQRDDERDKPGSGEATSGREDFVSFRLGPAITRGFRLPIDPGAARTATAGRMATYHARISFTGSDSSRVGIPPSKPLAVLSAIARNFLLSSERIIGRFAAQK